MPGITRVIAPLLYKLTRKLGVILNRTRTKAWITNNLAIAEKLVDMRVRGNRFLTPVNGLYVVGMLFQFDPGVIDFFAQIPLTAQ